jgi:hypothetical protein
MVEMEKIHQELRRRSNWRTAQLDIRFTNGAHFADCVDFLTKTGQTAEFWKTIGYLASMFRLDVAGRKGGNYGPPDEPADPPVEPMNVTLWLSPDSLNRPSFVWRAEATKDIPGSKSLMLLHGGMIYRDADGWSIHT